MAGAPHAENQGGEVMIVVEVIRKDGRGGVSIERFRYSDGVIIDEHFVDISSIKQIVITEVEDE